MNLLIIILAGFVLQVSCENSTLGRNTRTYLFKVTRQINENYDRNYRRTNQYRDIPEDDDLYEDSPPETLIQKNYEDPPDSFDSMKNRKRNYSRLQRFRNAYSSHLVDPEWRFNSNNRFVEIPDTVSHLYRSLEGKAEELDNISTIRAVFEDYDPDGNELMFNLDPLDNATADLVLDAELHVYRLSGYNESEEKPTNRHPTDEVIRLYQLLNFDSSEEDTTANPDLHRLLNVIYVSSSYSGWQIFKVRATVQNWLRGEDNLGFLLTATDSSDNPIELNIGRKYHLRYQPMLIVYMKSIESRSIDLPHLPKPSPNRLRGDVVNFRATNKFPNNASGCNKQIWYVSFQELGWNNFILEPSGFMAFQCRGGCAAPSAAGPTTNHGLLKHLFHSFVYVKRPCCVPDAYRPLVIMFLDARQNAVIKTYDDMIVDSCACR